MLTNTPALTSTLLGLAAAFLVLSVLVQIVQELYKFLTSSQSRTYTKVLLDTLGPWAGRLLRSDAIPDLLARGPLQVRRLRPTGVLLPLDRPTLTAALERTAPAWVQRTLKQLELEVELQGGEARPATPSWTAFVSELREMVATNDAEGKDEPRLRPPGYWSAREVFDFLDKWRAAPLADSKSGSDSEDSDGLDAQSLLTAFRREFLPHVEEAKRDYPQLMKNFEYSYRRRNFRQSFLIAFVIAFCFNLPFHELWRSARRLSPEQAVAAAERALELYEQASEATAAPASPQSQDAQETAKDPGEQEATAKDPGEQEATAKDPGEQEATEPAATSSEEAARQALGRRLNLLRSAVESEELSYFELWRQNDRLEIKLADWPRYFLGCLITAILLSFGAPLWNDLTKSLLGLQRRGRPRVTTPEEAAGGQD